MNSCIDNGVGDFSFSKLLTSALILTSDELVEEDTDTSADAEGSGELGEGFDSLPFSRSEESSADGESEGIL